tara:strand:+ start:686 stop:2566 length:1881 start_codon:yes stop_codon:yes gene_type:complete
MIVYKGTELDYREDTLQSLIIKGGLTKIDNLTDRTGTSSTQFNLPRTAKNELAFDNITTEGSELQTSGEAHISLEGNIFSQGTLHVTGYDNKNFKCLFMGADNDIIKELSTSKMFDLFNETDLLVYNDTNVKAMMQTPTTINGVKAMFSSPYQIVDTVKLDSVAMYLNIKDLIVKMFSGYNLISNYFNSDNGLNSYYTSGKIANQTKVANTFGSTGNIINNANSSYERLGSASASNTTITEATYSATGYKYVFTRASESVKIRARIYFDDPNNELDQFRFGITLRSSSNTTIQTTRSYTGGTELQQGYNDVTYSFDTSIGVNDYLWFNIFAFPNSGFSVGSLSGNVTIEYMTIETDTVASDDYLWVGSGLDMTKLEFLKGVLNQFNLVFDIDGSDVYIDLQDNGLDPITGAAISGIATETVNIDNIIAKEYTADISQIQSPIISFNQSVKSHPKVDAMGILPHQGYGSYLYNVNSFGRNSSEEVKSYFSIVFDYVDYLSSAYSSDPIRVDDFENTITSLCGDAFSTYAYQAKDNVTFENTDSTTTTVNALTTWNFPVRLKTLVNTLFINTLKQKKNNKVIEVIFRDELGTIVSNRKEYIFNNQVYKIVEWQYDIIKKLVKAKLIMK